MFWNKKKEKAAIKTKFGSFVWDGDFAWECEYQHNALKLNLSLIGKEFDIKYMERFDLAFQDIDSLISNVLDDCLIDIEGYNHQKSQMELFSISIDPNEKDEDFQFEFLFDEWPDGGLTIHIKDGKRIASHIDD